MLDRSPFFATAFSHPWAESGISEITLHPEDTDQNINQSAFELALRHIYGYNVASEVADNAVGLFATACWLELHDLISISVAKILKDMTPREVSPLIRLVTTNYYGHPGQSIVVAAKSILCRDGWEIPIKCWDGIPGDVVREIVGGDGFFINGEWERWKLARRLLNRRLKHKAYTLGLVEKGKTTNVKAPETLTFMAIRFDAVYRRENSLSSNQLSEINHKWIALYTDPDIEPLLVLLDEGIHYIYLEFEQLQYIRQVRDVFDLPLIPERVITSALWSGLELRQRVVNAAPDDVELGLSIRMEDWPDERPKPADCSSRDVPGNATSSVDKSKASASKDIKADDDTTMPSGSWDCNGRPRKFWIPTVDCNTLLGNESNTGSAPNLEPSDAQWATDFTASNPASVERNSIGARPYRSHGTSASTYEPMTYSKFPPFRFAVEFSNPLLLKEKKRVYSRTVFYAGSLWKIYIQRMRSNKGVQLGVYLHRAKETEYDDGFGLNMANNYSDTAHTVDERIDILEREMLIRNEQRHTAHAGDPPGTATEITSSSSANHGGVSTAYGAGTSRLRQMNLHKRHRSSASAVADLPSPSNARTFHENEMYESNASDDSESTEERRNPEARTGSILTSRAANRLSQLTIPPYTDARATIRTYFRIYSPSKGGRILSVYQSAPDNFNFSQSWGWKSNTMLEEGGLGLNSGDAEAAATSSESERLPSATSIAAEAVAGKKSGEWEQRKGVLRFMVVIGNV